MYGDNEELVAFQGRALDPSVGWEARYYTSGPRPFYNPWTHVRSGPLAVVEGPFDCFSVNRVVFAGAVLGNQISQRQIQEIVAVITRDDVGLVLIWLDRDASIAAVQLAQTLGRYVRTEIITSEGAKDPGELNAKEIRDVLKAHGHCHGK